jgi:precorrin-2 dehydrogenase/sirohydrochlorin ferrochelatase|tara:strand:+ start:221 stop:970 length:750 start_codon:yes stop_codon:yes gene_type:complete
MPAYYPVFLDLRHRKCIVIGGNKTSEEKVLSLLDFGAVVEIISPDITPGLRKIEDGKTLTWTQRTYETGDLAGAFIAIVADTTNSEINQSASEEARQRNIPLNVVDLTQLCTWIAPAIVKKGDIIIAASTGGSSPALARKLREQLERGSNLLSRHEVMDFADLAPFLAEARRELGRRGIKLNADHWQACMTDDLVDLVKSGNHIKVKETLLDSLLEGADCNCKNGSCLKYDELTQDVLLPINRPPDTVT